MMTFDDTLTNLKNYIEEDAKEIIKLIDSYKNSSIISSTTISLNAYDCVIPFTIYPQKDTEAYKNLYCYYKSRHYRGKSRQYDIIYM